jgi:hypothetical protein
LTLFSKKQKLYPSQTTLFFTLIQNFEHCASAYEHLSSPDWSLVALGVAFFRRYVCGDNSELHAQNIINWKLLPKLLDILQNSAPSPVIVLFFNSV